MGLNSDLCLNLHNIIEAAMALAYLDISIGPTVSSLRHTAISTKTKCDGSYV